MSDVTVNVPSVGLEAVFTFKEPINTYIRNKYNVNTLAIKLRVISIISMKDTIRSDLRDPFTDLYDPAGIAELDYKQDLLDNIPVISFIYVDSLGVEKFIRSPLNYIESISSISNIEYINKLILLDLNRLPTTVDTTIFFTELKDFIETRLGIIPEIKEVNIGEIELVDPTEHERRETIRRNTVTVYKTLSTRLEEMTLLYNQLLIRLEQLKITLGQEYRYEQLFHG